MMFKYAGLLAVLVSSSHLAAASDGAAPGLPEAPADVACPTLTQSVVNPACSQACDGACRVVTTVTNPCGCPAAIPTATLLAPCGAECPYDGCRVVFRSTSETCTSSRTRTRTRTRPTWSPTTTSTSTTSSIVVTTTIITLPPRPPTTTPCPTVTHTTRPSDCDPVRCPVPGCAVQESLVLPCGCSAPKTLLYVDGCQTACPAGCLTRTNTISQVCATASA